MHRHARLIPGSRRARHFYRGPQPQAAVADCGPWTIAIVERQAGVNGFQLLPRRWAVARGFAWLGRGRRRLEGL